MRALLEAGVPPDRPSADSGMTPLMWATNRHFFDCMEELLRAGANVNAISKSGDTAALFTRAGTPDDLRALEILCHHNINLGARDWRGRSIAREALDRERFGGNPSMRQLLERFYPDVDLQALA